jgi:hypothetical protein
MLHGFKTSTQEAHVNGVDQLPGDPLDRDTFNTEYEAAQNLGEAIRRGDLAEIESYARHFVNLRSLSRERRNRLQRIQRAA